MGLPYNPIELDISVIGLSLSILIDISIIRKLHHTDMERLVKPISVFLILLLVYRVSMWII